MRYIDIDEIKEGVFLAKPLYNDSGAKLLNQGAEITAPLLKRLKALNYSGLYIEDAISEGIDMVEIVSEGLRLQAAHTMKEIMTEDKDLSEIYPVISKFVDQIISNKETLIQINRLQNYHDYTYTHSINVGILSVRIGIEYDLSEEKLVKLGISGTLHDIGKQMVGLNIINKESSLTNEEFEIIKKHPLYGYQMIKDSIEISSISKMGVLDHHERYNGSGYPRKKSGNEISFFGRIVAIADTYDAMASKRCYRDAVPSSEIVEYLMGNAGKLYDYDLVNCFIKCIAIYPTGSCVELNNGQQAIVVKNYSDCILRPLIRVLDTLEEIDLKNDIRYLCLSITKLLQ